MFIGLSIRTATLIFRSGSGDLLPTSHLYHSGALQEKKILKGFFLIKIVLLTFPDIGLGRMVTLPTRTSSNNTILLMPVATLYSLTCKLWVFFQFG